MSRYLIWGEPSRWLLLEGLLPLFGAGALYLLFGILRCIAHNPPPKFKYAWKEWIDPLGWLYGSAILVFQAGRKCFFLHSYGLTFICFAMGLLSLFQLVAALVSRGEVPSWQPPVKLKIAAASLTLIILAVVYNVWVVASKGSHG